MDPSAASRGLAPDHSRNVLQGVPKQEYSFWTKLRPIRVNTTVDTREMNAQLLNVRVESFDSAR